MNQFISINQTVIVNNYIDSKFFILYCLNKNKANTQMMDSISIVNKNKKDSHPYTHTPTHNISSQNDNNSSNANSQYLNFIKHNHNMIENHLQLEFQHPYKMSLMKSHHITKESNNNKKNGGTSTIMSRKKQEMLSLRTIESSDLRKSLIFNITDNNNTHLQLQPLRMINNKVASRKQQICNSMNFINTPTPLPSGKSLHLSLASELSKRSNINSNMIISREDILHIVDEKNKQISQQLLKQRHNFSQIVYNKYDRHHHNQRVANTNNNVLERRYGDNSSNLTCIKSYVKEKVNNSNHQNNNRRYANKLQILNQNESHSTMQLSSNNNSNLLLPSIKKRSQSYHQQSSQLQNTDNNQSQNLLYLDSPESTQLFKSINQLRKQFQQKNSDCIKVCKKVQKNNIALKVKQINQKNLKSYYQYQSSIVKHSQLLSLQNKEIVNGKIKDNNNKNYNNNNNNDSKPLKALFNDNLVELSFNNKQFQTGDGLNVMMSQEEEHFLRQIAGNKSEEEIRKLLGSTMSPRGVNRYNEKRDSIDQQTAANGQQLGVSQPSKDITKSTISLSPSKRTTSIFHLKNIRSINTTKAQTTLYDTKISSYRQFALKIFFTYKKFHPLTIRQMSTTTMKSQQKFRFYVGKGNNSLLIHSLMKRRFWWVLEEDPKKAHFVWTQLKINSIFQKQTNAQPKSLYYKVEASQSIESAQNSIKKTNQSNKKKDPNSNQQKQKKSTIFKPPFPEDNQLKIFTIYDKKMFQKLSNALVESNSPYKWDNFNKRKVFFPQGYFQLLDEYQQSQQAKSSQQQNQQILPATKSYRVHNHFQFNHFMGNKKALFYNLRYYYSLIQKDVYDIIPLTFHIRNGQKDPQYSKFLKYYKAIEKRSNKNNQHQLLKTNKRKQRNIWIVKPGQNSNRGQGIQVFDQIYQLNNILRQKSTKNPTQQHTYIIQKYIQRPLLYKNRKFDIRHYFILARMWGKMKAYFFGEGYIRTSSYEFDLNNVGDTEIHLTNDAIQKYCDEYGKYEEGNKLSYVQFQRYLDHIGKEQGGNGSKSKCKGKQRKQFSFANDIYPQMRNIATEAIKACYIQMDPNRNEHNFEVFGMDFMIDRDFKVWLIQINTNPCLELSSKLLQRVIPSMVQQSLRLTIDILFPPPYHYPNSMKHMMPDYSVDKLKFELIFDQDRDGKLLSQLFNKHQQKQRCQNKKTIRQMLLGEIDQQDQTYENDGNELNVIDEKPYSLQVDC